MRLESYLVAELLQRLEQQGGALRSRALEIAAALNKDRYPVALETSMELTRMLSMFVATAASLQDHVVARDGMGEVGDSLAELILRARGMVLAAELGRLRAALDEPQARERTRGWFRGELHDIEAVASFLHARLTRIHAIWLPHRRDQPQPPGMTEMDRSNMYRTAIRVAQRALRELLDEPGLASFLHRGTAATDLAEINAACKQIVAALSVQIDTEPARYLLSRPHRALSESSEER
jgi:hypothetical protein